MPHGSLPALQEVFHEFGDRTRWLFMYVREAHPGEHLPSHGTIDRKWENARQEKIGVIFSRGPPEVFAQEIDGRSDRRGKDPGAFVRIAGVRSDPRAVFLIARHKDDVLSFSWSFAPFIDDPWVARLSEQAERHRHPYQQVEDRPHRFQAEMGHVVSSS
jgi:hypothetical protein